MSAFVHLRVHTEYSLRDSTVRLKPLFARAKALGMPAIALTDEANLFALVKFYRGAEAAGIKPIVGTDIEVVDGDQTLRMGLYCQHRDGYRNLSRLLTLAQLKGRDQGRARLQAEWLQEHHEGLLAVAVSTEADLAKYLGQGEDDAAQALVQPWQELFGDRLYMDLQRTGLKDHLLAPALDLALRLDIPVLASNEVRFLDSEDFHSHEARVCIHDSDRLDDARRVRRYSDSQYLKSAPEMAELFADIPAALSNTVEFAKRCNLKLEFGNNVLPDYPVPDGYTAESFLAEEARKGLDRRFELGRLHASEQDYRDRLEREIGVINEMGFPGYFLIVADFIRWSRENDVPVGPGRGSGAGSVVAWVLEITDLDPLQFDLLFERFLNPERVSMPDFDVDFCIAGRDKVIDYVAERYGRDRVSQIITYGSMAAKAVIRDVGRVLGHGYGYVDRIAKLIPNELGISLTGALTGLEEGQIATELENGRSVSDLIQESRSEMAQVYRDEEEVTELINTALKLEGLSRNAGKHAGGVVIAPEPLTEYTPLYMDPEGHPVTQFDKDDVEAVGLVKFDFLGLKTLTVVDHATKLVNISRAAKGEAPIDIRNLELDDPGVYRLLQSGKVAACFQIESLGMRQLVRKLQPDTFEDIVSLLALFRPGPLQSGMVDDFVMRKHGEQEIVYPHASLEPILKPTYGVILYQEQVMQIAQVLSGYSLGGADLLRRAMGKKKAEVMAAERGKFVDGAENNDVDGKLAGEIFDLIEKFAGYGFNKSHSAAYAYVAYQTAWLKAHYAPHFLCAVMCADLDNTDKLVPLLDDCRQLKLPVDGPCINASDYRFTVVNDQRIRYGLGALKGVGQGPVEVILEAREKEGPFKDIFEFCRRLDLKRMNKRVLEALIKAGALDVFGEHRAALLSALPQAIAAAEQDAAAAAAGQVDLFGEAVQQAQDIEMPDVPPWQTEELLQAEKDSLGLYFTVHPMDLYRRDFSQLVGNNFAGMIANEAAQTPKKSAGKRRWRKRGRDVLAAGVLWSVRFQGEIRAFINLDDGTDRISAVLSGEDLELNRHRLRREQPLMIFGELSYDDYEDGYRIRPQEILDLDDVRRRFAIGVLISVEDDFDYASLQKILNQYKTMPGLPVMMSIRSNGQQADFRLGNDWRIEINEALLRDLDQLCGADRVQVRYRRPDFGRNNQAEGQ
ncbi:MAG: DNA polymerase III subunit alpha [Oceanococcus sp.]